MAGDCDPTWLSWMLVLSMATLGRDQVPAIVFNQFYDIADLHKVQVCGRE
jgi:hypothetical protein